MIIIEGGSCICCRGWAFVVLAESSSSSTTTTIAQAQAMERALAPWRSLLAHSLHENSALTHSSYLQLATVRPDGRPANRTVVYRDFVEGTDMIQFTTDIRSRKIAEIQNNPVGEICWYFTDSWEQFRIQGVLDVIRGSETNKMKLNLREKAWFASSMNLRLQFMGPHPKLPCLTKNSELQAQLDPEQGPVETFCLVTLNPEEVDYVNLKENRRVIFKRTEKTTVSIGQWTEMEVNP